VINIVFHSEEWMLLIYRKMSKDIDVSELIPELPDWYVNLVCEHDYDTERIFMKEDRDEMFFLFRVTGLLRKESL